ncbi:MAG: elongation factor P maturation arginine rhamnosyltransferase EarP [Ignavibacteria bacterium]
MGLSCDIFCKVVDNYGDAGVCWRLARQLANEQAWRVRLWIDDASPLARLQPGLDAQCERQEVDGVEVCRWVQPFPEVQPGQVVIEAFACELPTAYVEAMAALERQPVWVNLEYLSAEAWVTGCHAMTSPHPTLPLVKHFFFPGFTAGTGGLILERDADFGARQPGPALAISLFCYMNRALAALLDTWAAGGEPVVCHVAEGVPSRQVAAWLGEDFRPGAERRRGSLALRALPFLAQPDYDRLLGGCDLNFVRGEDSFVRAQWAGRPFVWQIYPQEEGAHMAKLDAFLDLYADGLDDEAGTAVRRFFRAWNGAGEVDATWSPFRHALPRLSVHGESWARHMAGLGNLAENLAEFCAERI